MSYARNDTSCDEDSSATITLAADGAADDDGVGDDDGGDEARTHVIDVASPVRCCDANGVMLIAPSPSWM